MAKKAELDILDLPGDENAEKIAGSSETDSGENGQLAAEGPLSQEARAPEGPWYRKRGLLFSALALLVVLVAFSGLFLKYHGFRGFHGTAVTEEAVPVQANPSHWVPFHELIIPVKDGQDRDRILRLDFFVEVEPAGEPVAEDWMRHRRNDIYQTIRQVSFPVPVSSRERKTLKETLVQSLSPYFGKDRIKGIYFTELFII